MKQKKTTKTVAILGGGLAGLAAAYELSRRGYKTIVIEAGDDVGGLARTIERNGFCFDTGPHRWYTKSDSVNRWMLEFMDDEIIKVPRLTRIYFDRKFFYYPIRFKNVLTNIGIFKAARSVFDYMIVRAKARINPQKPVTLEDGYIQKFGKTLYETFFKRYSEKLWGQSCRQVSADWIGQRTRGFNIGHLLKNALSTSRNVVSFVDEFSYPDRGIGRIAQKLAEQTKKHGGTVRINTRVVAVTQGKNTITSVTVSHGKKTEKVVADQFISTIALSDLVNMLVPRAPKSTRALSAKLSYRDQVQVALFIRKAHITADTWIYVHPENISFMRVMEMDNWSTKLSPKGTTTLLFEISCNQGDKWWQMQDSDLIEQVTHEFINEFGLIGKEDVIGGFVHRVLKEYPIYHIGYRQDVGKIKHYLRTFDNLQIAGRNGTFRYNNMDHSIEMGLYAAWNIIEKTDQYDIESVNIDREYLEEKDIVNQ